MPSICFRERLVFSARYATVADFVIVFATGDLLSIQGWWLNANCIITTGRAAGLPAREAEFPRRGPAAIRAESGFRGLDLVKGGVGGFAISIGMKEGVQRGAQRRH